MNAFSLYEDTSETRFFFFFYKSAVEAEEVEDKREEKGPPPPSPCSNTYTYLWSTPVLCSLLFCVPHKANLFCSLYPKTLTINHLLFFIVFCAQEVPFVKHTRTHTHTHTHGMKGSEYSPMYMRYEWNNLYFDKHIKVKCIQKYEPSEWYFILVY